MSTQADRYFSAMGRAIERDESIKQSKRERGENAIALWRTLAAMAPSVFSDSIRERGNQTADNINGTPSDCFRFDSLLSDLEWCISKRNL